MRVRTMVAPVVALVLAALVLVVSGCTGGGTGPAVTVSPTPTSTPTGSTAPTATAEAATVPVYYLTDTPVGLRLAREFQQAKVADGRAKAAVEHMLSQPAADPDYASLWNPDTQVLGIDAADDVITVDLSAEARTASVGSAAAELAVQQLVYTVTAAEQSDAGVQLLIDGRPAGELWGHVVWDAPIARAPAIDVRLLAQINDPAQGSAVGQTFTVTGEAATFEAVLPWRLVDSSGATARSGSAMTAQGQALAPFEFTIDAGGLSGPYILVVQQDDPSGGEGGGAMADTKSITIR